MSNKNALIAMAHVSENANNPYHVFEEYIKYSIFTSGKATLSISEAKDAVKDEFGIYIPHYVFVSCLNNIAAEGLIISKDSRISIIGEYDTEPFESIRTAYQSTEQKLVEGLINFVSRYELTWDYEKAREQLIRVLDCNGLAYEVFLHNKDVSEETINDSLELQIESDEDCSLDQEEIDSQPLYSDSFFVGRYVSKLLTSDLPEKQYLQKVCEGLMITIGANQMPSVGSNNAYPRIKGTEFYFDTRLLLRYVGCAGDAAVNASQELIEMIQNNGGRVYYYPHTFLEMDHALENAILYKKGQKDYLDYEMRIYAQKNTISVLSAKRANLENELSRASIYEKPLGNYTDTEKITFGFDYTDWKNYFIKNLRWRTKAVENDALSIWETHMRRRGDYRDYCGTKKHLCVFVTNNSRLIGASLKFKEERSSLNSISGWRNNRLPVITDIRLTCRLWSPAEQSERMSLLYLTSNAVAAQRPTQRYINEMRTLVTQLSKEVPEYENICLPELFDDNITDSLLEKTHGVASTFSIGTLTTTLDELTEYKALQEQKRTKEYQEKLRKANDSLTDSKNKIEEQENSIIESAITANTNTLGLTSRIKLYLVLYWAEIVGALFVVITSLCTFALQNLSLLWLVIIPVVLYLAERFIIRKTISKRILSKVLPRIIDKYKLKIIQNLRPVEIPYKDKIIPEVIRKTDLISKCKKKLK